MKQNDVIFPCGDIKLEGIFFEILGEKQVPAVVVCHPHPLYGGSMHNNVTFALAEAIVTRGIASLLFNFRGVGRSEGQHGGGVAEQEDIMAALDWLQKQSAVAPLKLGLAGYSFGAAVALPVACRDQRVRAIALVSPYFDSSHEDLLKRCTLPKLMVNGGADSLVSPETVATYMNLAAEPKKQVQIEGADHLWGGYEDKMAAVVADFFADLLL